MTISKDSVNLDILRAFAVLAVFYDHFCITLSLRPLGFLPPYYLGRFGVLIFFVHTSLVLMMSLERSHASDWALVGGFYLRRFFRIYPLSVAVCLFVYFCKFPPFSTTPAEAFHTPPLGALFASLALLQNLTLSQEVLSPLWSLPLEVQMYLMLPIFFLYLRKTKRVHPVLLSFVIAAVLGAMQIKLSSRLNIFSYIPCFLGGLLAYQMAKTPRRSLAGSLWPIAILACTAMFFVMPGSHLNPYKGWIVCCTLGALIPWFQDVTVPAIPWFAKIVAKYSYGIYLTHIPIMWLTLKHLPARWPIWWCWSLFAVSSLIAPVVMYHAIESPFIGFGGRLARRLVDRPARDIIRYAKARTASVGLCEARSPGTLGEG
jgi:peptidoglycan/LPS O-acetylase OafA/YrhL